MRSTAILIGPPALCDTLERQLALLPETPILLGRVHVGHADSPGAGAPVLGTLEQLETVCASRTPRMALVTLPAPMSELLLSIRTRLRKLGVTDRFMPSLERFPKPVVAAVNGVGVGIGLTMLLHCDLVLMARSARLKVPFLSLGVTTEASASLLLPAVMGWQRAAEVVFCEPWVDADAAVDAGLALRAVDDDALLAEARSMADRVASFPLASIVATKELMLAGRAEAVELARLRELAAFERLVGAMFDEAG